MELIGTNYQGRSNENAIPSENVEKNVNDNDPYESDYLEDDGAKNIIVSDLDYDCSIHDNGNQNLRTSIRIQNKKPSKGKLNTYTYDL